MKEHALSPSDRAALQSLIPLASALGVGTMFALFFGPRKRTAYAVFEIFAIVSVLVAAALTASIAISLLHEDKAISDHDLTLTAMPLVVAAFLLVFLTVLARLRAAGNRGWSMLPVGLACVYVAAMLTLKVWATTPEDASMVAGVLLAVGGLLSVAVAAWERWSTRGSRRGRARELGKKIAAGYVLDRKPLLPSLPKGDGEDVTEVACWVKRGRTYLDFDGCQRLGELVRKRWDGMGDARMQPPTGSRILTAVDALYRLPFRRRRPEARVSMVRVPDGENDVKAAPINEDGLVDVTDLGLL